MKLIKVMPVPAPVGAIYNEIVAAVSAVSPTPVVGVWVHTSTEVMVAVHETVNKVPDYVARFVDQEIHIFCLNQRAI